MSEYNGYTAPMADYNIIKEQAEESMEARRPITLEEMMDLRTFFGNRGVGSDKFFEGYKRKSYFDTKKEAE